MEDEERKVDLSHRTIQDEQARLRKKRQKAENVFAVFKKPLHESLTSVLPVMLIVLVLCFTIAPVPNNAMVAFLLGGVMLIAGMGLFTLGSEMSMIPLGQAVGSEITRRKKVWIIAVVGFLIGMIITVAEPDLQVLASQIAGVVSSTMLIVTVGFGVGLFLLMAVLKMLFHKSLSSMLMFFYMTLFALTALVVVNGNVDFLPMAFDSGGVTTGPITVPFIMALGVGIAATLGGRDVGENSFGLVALCSIGPILAVLLLGITADSGKVNIQPSYDLADDFGVALGRSLLTTSGEVLLALGLIVLFFLILQVTCLKLPVRKVGQIGIGILYTFAGLVLFLSVVNVGYMPIGYKLGTELASSHPVALVVFSFILGMVVVLAEPAVHVLNKQVEDITAGHVSKRSMMIALSVGVGISIGLSMLRILLDFSILYYVIPGYLISLGLSFFVPGLYTAIAFDSGGVASGPLTSSFILPFAVGACMVAQGQSHILSDAFGVVAMVAMTPLITIQLLGFRSVVTRRVRAKIAMRRILLADDEQIIDFM